MFVSLFIPAIRLKPSAYEVKCDPLVGQHTSYRLWKQFLVVGASKFEATTAVVLCLFIANAWCKVQVNACTNWCHVFVTHKACALI